MRVFFSDLMQSSPLVGIMDSRRVGCRCGIVALLLFVLPFDWLPGQALQPGFNQVAIGNVGPGQFDTRAWGVGEFLRLRFSKL